MAKIIKCALCGKEVTNGLFSGDAEQLQIADGLNINVCPECYKEYSKIAKAERERFTTKLANIKWETRAKFTSEQLANTYKNYIAERNDKMSRTVGSANKQGRFYIYNDNGFFGWTERRMGFMGSDISTNDKLKALEKNISSDAFCFTKDDVSCIEFRLANSEQLGMFSKSYNIEICLNHERNLTYKPCYGRTVVVVSGILGYKKKAIREAVEMLESFKAHIGVSLPVKYVKKFK